MAYRYGDDFRVNQSSRDSLACYHMPVQERDRLVWMDLEMTGLNPDRERIIEIAAVVTDGQLAVIAEGPTIVIHQPEALLQAMDAWNQHHHGASGLIDEVRASTVTDAEAEARVLAFVSEHCERGACPLAGNSVHRDRRFLRRYMRQLDEYLHYRIIDVSTVKELVKRWYPQVFAQAPEKGDNHRALGDIHESIAELRYYRESVFRDSPG